MAVPIQSETTDHNNVVFRCIGRASHDGTDPRCQMVSGVGLDNIVVCPGIKNRDDVRFVVSGGCDNDGHVADGPDHSKRFGAIKIRKSQVEDHHVKIAGDTALDPVHGIGDGLDVVSTLGETFRKRFADSLLVLDDQDRCHDTTLPSQIASGLLVTQHMVHR